MTLPSKASARRRHPELRDTDPPPAQVGRARTQGCLRNSTDGPGAGLAAAHSRQTRRSHGVGSPGLGAKRAPGDVGAPVSGSSLPNSGSLLHMEKESYGANRRTPVSAGAGLLSRVHSWPYPGQVPPRPGVRLGNTALTQRGGPSQTHVCSAPVHAQPSLLQAVGKPCRAHWTAAAALPTASGP